MTLIPIISKNFMNLYGNDVYHGFFTRVGGVSKGNYKSLNFNIRSQDNIDNILENKKILSKNILIKEQYIIILHQIHSTRTIIVNNILESYSMRADSMVTNINGLALCILTADCCPVFFFDKKKKIIAAAHVGWRGALYGILENTISCMESIGANRKNIISIIGPCIGKDKYIIDKNFFNKFYSYSKKNEKYFFNMLKNEKYFFNLRFFIKDILKNFQIKIFSLDICSYKRNDLFFSYRRSIKNNKKDCGRQISVIILKN